MTLSLQHPSKTRPRHAARAKPSHANITARPGLKNRRALKLLADWASVPDDLGAGWWAQFERELAAAHFSIRSE